MAIVERESISCFVFADVGGVDGKGKTCPRAFRSKYDDMISYRHIQFALARGSIVTFYMMSMLTKVLKSHRTFHWVREGYQILMLT